MAEAAKTPTGRRRRSRIAIFAALAYAGFYLFAIGDVDLVGPPAWDARLGEVTAQRILSARAPFQFEAVAVLEAGYLVWLVSPLNLLVAAILAALLAANIAGALYLRAHAQCGTGGKSTLGSALPALMAGGACCAPSLILLLGVPGLGALAAWLPWLVPVSMFALAANRWWQHRQGAPPLVRRGATTRRPWCRGRAFGQGAGP
jgi:hypothetical protein